MFLTHYCVLFFKNENKGNFIFTKCSPFFLKDTKRKLILNAREWYVKQIKIIHY